MPHIARRALLAATLATLVACGKDVVAPTSTTQHTSPPLRPSSLVLVYGDTSVFNFDYVPATGGTYVFDTTTKIVFPANSICDPQTANYGTAGWDDACAPLQAPLRIVAKAWLDVANHAHVEFYPHLRFVPNQDQDRWVKLFLRDANASDPFLSALLTIQYCNDLGVCVDEAQSDPTLATHAQPADGMLWRRIKHFSGYNVAAGRVAAPPPPLTY
jgi:hypothetical protein